MEATITNTSGHSNHSNTIEISRDAARVEIEEYFSQQFQCDDFNYFASDGVIEAEIDGEKQTFSVKITARSWGGSLMVGVLKSEFKAGK